MTSDWKQKVFPMLETHTDRLPGAFIEEKSYSLAWHYRPAALAEAIKLGQLTQKALGELDERAQFLRTCRAHGWNTAGIMTELGISRTTLNRRLRELGISLREVKKYHLVPRCADQSEPTA